MQNSTQSQDSFESLKKRLEEIAEAVGDESMALDDALDLFEEAVALGLRATDLLEDGINIDEESPDEQDGDATLPTEQTSDTAPAASGADAEGTADEKAAALGTQPQVDSHTAN